MAATDFPVASVMRGNLTGMKPAILQVQSMLLLHHERLTQLEMQVKPRIASFLATSMNICLLPVVDAVSYNNDNLTSAWLQVC